MRAARLGAGLTSVPPAPPVDAAKAIMAHAEVPEDKRSCSKCGNKVGRSIDGKPGRAEGFCANCGQAFSFTPKLQQGDLVAGQYEVAGALAHGGLGWIYLARDRNVSNRWVVLKGLLNSGDPDALAAAIAEQQFLAQVEHPAIVEIYNFVTHEGAGYIVMEYVGGKSLKQILKDRMRANNGAYDPMPVDQALAYILELLPAFQYLHDLGLIYCDFKPDNMIQVGDAMKLIDLGGVRRADDEESAIYGTVGYQAPEVAEVGVSVASDIYTIGRTLLVLTMEFRGYQGTYLHSLPPVDSTPLFQQYDSLYHLVAKCCAADPADRFASVDELRTQLLGVLREVVARTRQGTALTSAASVLFESPATARPITEWSQLPKLREDTTDPQHGWLSTIGTEEPAPAAQGPRRRARRTPPRCGWPAARRRSSSRSRRRPRAMPATCSPPTRGSGGRCGWRVSPPSSRRTGTTRRPRSTRSTSRCPASSRPSWRWRSPARRAVSRRSPRASTRPVQPPTRRTSLRPRSGWRGCGRPAATPPVRWRRSTWCRPPAAATRRAGSSAPRCCSPAARWISRCSTRRCGRSRARPSTARPASATPCGSSRRRCRWWRRTRRARASSIGSVQASEPDIRAGLENALRLLARDAHDLDERVDLVNQANAVRNWSLT